MTYAPRIQKIEVRSADDPPEGDAKPKKNDRSIRPPGGFENTASVGGREMEEGDDGMCMNIPVFGSDADLAAKPFPAKILCLILLFVHAPIVEHEYASALKDMLAISGVCRAWRYYGNYMPQWLVLSCRCAVKVPASPAVGAAVWRVTTPRTYRQQQRR